MVAGLSLVPDRAVHPVGVSAPDCAGLMRMTIPYRRRAFLPLSEDAATRLVHLAGVFLTNGQPEKAASAYKAAAHYAQTPQGQRECRLMAAELEFGLLVKATVH